MSHVTKIELRIESLEALKRAAEELGCELVENVSTFRAYYDNTDNRCDHVIRIKGKSNAYEVGVQRQEDGSYKLAMDNYLGAKGLVAQVGEDALELRRRYSACFAEDHWKEKRYTVRREVTTDGRIRVTAERRRY